MLRQVPPSVARFSTQATFMPSCAARMAQTYPPGPEPMTMTSKESGMEAPMHSHSPNNNRRGSSTPSFTRTRNDTASLPSTMR